MSHASTQAVVGTAPDVSVENLRHPAADEAATVMIDVVFPESANHHGTLFGGAALSMMDKLAFVVATRCTRRRMVTACSGGIDFVTPIQQGRLVELRGRVVRRGRRSLDVEVGLVAEDLGSGERSHSLNGRFTLVAVDDDAPRQRAVPATAGEDDGSERTTMVEPVFPGHTNHLGTLYGGQALAWLGKAAFVAASRRARMPVVMAASERIDFHAPVLEGELVELDARVVRVGNASMCVEVSMHAEDLLSGQRRLCTRGRFTMVALGYDGRPVPVPR